MLAIISSPFFKTVLLHSPPYLVSTKQIMFPKRRIVLGVTKRTSTCKASHIFMLKYSLFFKSALLLKLEICACRICSWLPTCKIRSQFLTHLLYLFYMHQKEKPVQKETEWFLFVWKLSDTYEEVFPKLQKLISGQLIYQHKLPVPATGWILIIFLYWIQNDF